LPPVPITSVGGNFSFTNHTADGPSSGPDVGAAVGWSILSLLVLVLGLAAFALLTSKRLRVWLLFRIRQSR